MTRQVGAFAVKSAAWTSKTFQRARQYTAEKTGKAERTELDYHFEQLSSDAERTQKGTERILKACEAYLEPNPSTCRAVPGGTGRCGVRRSAPARAQTTAWSGRWAAAAVQVGKNARSTPLEDPAGVPPLAMSWVGAAQGGAGRRAGCSRRWASRGARLCRPRRTASSCPTRRSSRAR